MNLLNKFSIYALKTSFFLLLVLTISPHKSYAATYYVSTIGNDNNNGNSVATAWNSVPRSVTKLHAGDKLHIVAGKYNLISMISFWGIAGTASSPITIEGEGSATILDGSFLPQNTVWIGNTSYLNLTNLVIQNSPKGHLIGMQSANHVTISLVELKYAYINGVYMDSTDSNITLFKVHAHHNAMQNLNAVNANTGKWGQGINLGGTNNKADSCLVEYNWGEGIDVQESNGAQIINNISHDNYSVLIYMDHARNVVIERNLAYYSYTNPTYYYNGYPGGGIIIADEAYDATHLNSGNIIRNNIIVHTVDGISYRAYGDNAGIHSTHIWNNTIVNPTYTGIRIDTPNLATDTSIMNNIVYASLPFSRLMNITAAGYSGIDIQNNFWYAPQATNPSIINWGNAYGQASMISGPNDIGSVDPLFTGGCTGSLISATCYTLKSTSPAKNSAYFDSTVVATDFNGITRKKPTSMGAYQ